MSRQPLAFWIMITKVIRSISQTGFFWNSTSNNTIDCQYLLYQLTPWLMEPAFTRTRIAGGRAPLAQEEAVSNLVLSQCSIYFCQYFYPFYVKRKEAPSLILYKLITSVLEIVMCQARAPVCRVISLLIGNLTGRNKLPRPF